MTALTSDSPALAPGRPVYLDEENRGQALAVTPWLLNRMQVAFGMSPESAATAARLAQEETNGNLIQGIALVQARNTPVPAGKDPESFVRDEADILPRIWRNQYEWPYRRAIVSEPPQDPVPAPRGMPPDMEETLSRFAPKDRAPLMASLQSMPTPLRQFLYQGGADLMAAQDTRVPPDLRQQISKRAQGGLPSVCCLTDDRQLLVVLGRPTDLGHELIHATQVKADRPSMQGAFNLAVADGGRIVEAARNKVRGGQPAADYADLTASLNFIKELGTPGKPGVSLDTRIMQSFDLHMIFHPRSPTEEIGKELGLPDRAAVGAAVFAHYLSAKGYTDPTVDVAREVVAYRFQHDLAPLRPLFSNALERIDYVPPLTPVKPARKIERDER